MLLSPAEQFISAAKHPLWPSVSLPAFFIAPCSTFFLVSPIDQFKKMLNVVKIICVVIFLVSAECVSAARSMPQVANCLHLFLLYRMSATT